jgi:hypothetical protein
VPLKETPCHNWVHDFYPNYLAFLYCGTDYCTGYEKHCMDCGWFISECGCGSCNGASKISDKAEKAIKKRKIKTPRFELAL